MKPTTLTKWLQRLTKEQILEFQKTQDKSIDNKITVNMNNNWAIVQFWEYGWGNTTEDQKIAIPTQYELTDYSMKPYDVYFSEEEEIKMNQNLIQFMTIEFGTEYLADLLWSKTGIDPEFFLPLLNKNQKQ